MSFRIINFTENDGTNEKMVITEELETSVEDFLPIGFSVYTDVIFEGHHLPSGFPLNYEWTRK